VIGGGGLAAARDALANTIFAHPESRCFMPIHIKAMTGNPVAILLWPRDFSASPAG
jgi:hypothetical protein